MSDQHCVPHANTGLMRNIANHGRGSTMTEMLHIAADEIDGLRNKLAKVRQWAHEAEPNEHLDQLQDILDGSAILQGDSQ